MKQSTFKAFCDIAYAQAGISLGPSKLALVQSRVAKRMRNLSLESEEEYLQYLKNDSSGEEMIKFLDAISTNLTYFYREKQHFNIMEKILRHDAEKNPSRFRLWCAASSTGEEPYTLAMILRETLPSTCDMRILATDICTDVLEKAQRGVYLNEKMKEIPPELRTKYFIPSTLLDAPCSEASSELKRILLFKRLNLSRTPFPMKGPLDMVFCRNVMIYFDTKVRQKLVSEIYRLLKPGGYLFVGHSESLSALSHSFTSIAPAVYKK